MEKVKEALRRRIPIGQFTAGRIPGKPVNHSLIIVDSGKFRREYRRNPEFAALVDDFNKDELERRVRRVKARNGKKKYDTLHAMLPAQLPEDAKVEIISMIVEAVGKRSYRGDRQFGMGKVQANIKKFVADYNKLNPMKTYGEVHSPWSLDEAVPGTAGLTRIDTISDGMWS